MHCMHGSTMHVALSPGAIPSFAAHRKGCFSVCNTAKLGIGSGDMAMNLPGDFQTVFFFF